MSVELQDVDRSKALSSQPELQPLPGTYIQEACNNLPLLRAAEITAPAPGIPMWLNDCKSKEPDRVAKLPSTGRIEEDINEMLAEFDLNDHELQLTRNPMCLEDSPEVAQAKAAAMEVFAGVMVFVKLHRRFIKRKAKMTAYAEIA